MRERERVYVVSVGACACSMHFAGAVAIEDAEALEDSVGVVDVERGHPSIAAPVVKRDAQW